MWNIISYFLAKNEKYMNYSCNKRFHVVYLKSYEIGERDEDTLNFIINMIWYQ